MHSAAFFKIKRSKTLPMLKSSQMKFFCTLEAIYKFKKKDFSKSRPPAGQHKQKQLSVYFQKKHVFSKKGRPQGITNKNDYSYIFKKIMYFQEKAARRATQTKTTKRLFSKKHPGRNQILKFEINH